MDFRQQYLKYKKKYLKLKNITGGDNVMFIGNNKYTIDSEKNGIFDGKILINGYDATKIVYDGKWDVNDYDKFHYFGKFIKKDKTEYKIDCIGFFSNNDGIISFNGLYSDKLLYKNYDTFINKPLNGYTPSNIEYYSLNGNVILNTDSDFKKKLGPLRFVNKDSNINYISLNNYLFYQKGWYCLIYNNRANSFYKLIKHGFNACNKIINHIQIDNNIKEDRQKNVIENIEELNINIYLITIKYTSVNINGFVFGPNYTYKFSFIVGDIESIIHKKTIILCDYEDKICLLLHNDDIIKYNLIRDITLYDKERDIVIPEIKIFGINNISNSCYLNASLQFLLRCPPFYKYLFLNLQRNKRDEFYKENLRDYFYDISDGFIKKFFFIFENNFKKEKEYYIYEDTPNITSIRDTVFENNRQQDAEEFLNKIIDIIFDNNLLFDTDLYEDYKSDNDLYFVMLQYIHNPINKIFSIYTKSSIICGSGTQKTVISAKVDKLHFISLPIIFQKVNGSFYLNECLENYFKEEKITKEESFNIHCIDNMYKKIELCFLPEIVITVLKRFEYNRSNTTRNKIKDSAIIDSEIDFGKYMVPVMECKYKLTSYIIHSGENDGGHYYMYSYNDNLNMWIKYNDSSISEHEYMEQLDDAYILMYQRI